MVREIYEMRRPFYIGDRLHTVASVPGMAFHPFNDLAFTVITYPNRSPLLATNGRMGDLVLTDLSKPRLYKSKDGDEWLCNGAPGMVPGKSWQELAGGFAREWGWTPLGAYAAWVTGTWS